MVLANTYHLALRPGEEVVRAVAEGLIRAKTAARLVEIYRDTLRPQAQATLRAASAAYQTDQTDFLNLIDSQNTALDVETQLAPAASTAAAEATSLTPPPTVNGMVVTSATRRTTSSNVARRSTVAVMSSMASSSAPALQ